MQNDITNILNKAKNIIIVPKKDDKDSFFASLPFLNIFFELKKNVNLLSNEPTENYSLFLKSYTPKFYSKIKIYIKDVDNLQIFYEKRENLNILFLQNGQNLLLKNIETISTEDTDFIISIGNLSLTELETILKEHNIIINQKPLILNIDNKILNENFGDINYVDINSSSICELVFDILYKRFPSALNSENANALLSGIIINTKSFQVKKFGPTTLKKFIFLKKNTDFNKILDLFFKNKINKKSILFRILNNIDFIEEKDIFVAEIIPEYIESFSFKNEIIKSLELITQNSALSINFLLILKQTIKEENVVILYSHSKEIIEKVKILFNGKQKNNWVLFNTKEDSNLIKQEILNIF
ncbi:MAG: DHH family phosphoesterase [Minisyncoccia bacterium]